ncbi:hypothetical protein SVAN01_11219 [Stagonosporopsis vannaccii]|nr:hypothetical protein SVAN01_11219 [Stagonosporopsis vannaccii]
MQDVIRASQPVHTATTPSNTFRSATVVAARPTAFDREALAKDERKIKIDFDDPMFTWDNDAPVTPPTKHGQRRRQAQIKLKRTTAKLKTGSCTAVANATGLMKDADDSEKQHRGHIVKGSKRTENINRGIRATSYDLDFIVPDDEILEHQDDRHSDPDDITACDIDMTDDGTDLVIDMEPEFAYNSDVLLSATLSHQ